MAFSRTRGWWRVVALHRRRSSPPRRRQAVPAGREIEDPVRRLVGEAAVAHGSGHKAELGLAQGLLSSRPGHAPDFGAGVRERIAHTRRRPVARSVAGTRVGQRRYGPARVKAGLTTPPVQDARASIGSKHGPRRPPPRAFSWDQGVPVHLASRIRGGFRTPPVCWDGGRVCATSQALSAPAARSWLHESRAASAGSAAPKSGPHVRWTREQPRGSRPEADRTRGRSPPDRRSGAPPETLVQIGAPPPRCSRPPSRARANLRRGVVRPRCRATCPWPRHYRVAATAVCQRADV